MTLIAVTNRENRGILFLEKSTEVSKMMIRGLSIKVVEIPNNEQRYPTVADYYQKDGVLLILLSEEMDWRSRVAVLEHELLELQLLCDKFPDLTIDEIVEMVDTFDKEFARHQDPDDPKEPGDDPAAPYHEEHQLATERERQSVEGFGLSWKEHDTAILHLMRQHPDYGKA